MSECRSGRLQALRQPPAFRSVISVLFSQRTVQPAYSSSAKAVHQPASVQVQRLPRPAFRSGQRPFRPAFRSGQHRSAQGSTRPVFLFRPAFHQRSVQASVPVQASVCSGQRAVQASVPFSQRSVQAFHPVFCLWPAFRSASVRSGPERCPSALSPPNDVRVLKSRTMSECRSGSPNDVRVLPDAQAFARPQPAYRSASVPFRPAFRSGQRSVQPAYSFARSPNDVRVLKSPKRCPSAVQAATRSSPGCHQVFTKLFGKRCPSA
jgi:hypothetical protein